MRSAAPNTVPTFQPLYRQIKDLLVRSLDGGAWKPGQAIPSELELAGRFGVSQGTVRKAVDELAAENMLVRRQGKGTFVATHGEPRQNFRFLRLMPNQGEPAQYESRASECRRARAGVDVARFLDLKPGDGVIFIRRVLFFGGEPTVVEEITLPALPFKGLTAAKLAAHRGSIYHLYETEFGTQMIRADEKLRAVAADAATAGALGLAKGTPLLSVERVAYTYGDRPVEYRYGLCRTDTHFYRNELG
ncbi:MAG: GntR family transcriptional regulator [Betaproteobacteria bacterium]|jgi:GntR family transcriptional regulator|nr:GntR family transcriptional regulator [Betaproteobacteria bacterium]